MFLNENEIIGMSLTEKPLIVGFEDKEIKHWMNGKEEVKVVSYGLTQNSYDIRLGRGVELFAQYPITDIPLCDPLAKPRTVDIDKPHMLPRVEKTIYTEEDSVALVYYDIPSNAFVLARSEESFNIPADVTGFLYCKSTYARLGMNMTPTVLKSGWSGQLVLEIFNQSPYVLRIYEGQGIGTLYFAQHDAASNSPYDGKYQGQVGITHAR